MELGIHGLLDSQANKYLALYYSALNYLRTEKCDGADFSIKDAKDNIELVFKAMFNTELTKAERNFVHELAGACDENCVFALLVLLHNNITCLSWPTLIRACLEIDSLCAEFAPQLYDFYHGLQTVSQSFHFAIPFLESACVGLLEGKDCAEGIEIILRQSSGFRDLKFFAFLLFRVYNARFEGGLQDESVFIFDRIAFSVEFLQESSKAFEQHIERRSNNTAVPHSRIEDPLARDKLISVCRDNLALFAELNTIVTKIESKELASAELYDAIKATQYACQALLPFKPVTFVQAEEIDRSATMAWMLARSTTH